VLRSSTVQFQNDVGNAVVEICADERHRCCSRCRVESWGGWVRKNGYYSTSPCSEEMSSSCAPRSTLWRA
jgi:hypothetical protein